MKKKIIKLFAMSACTIIGFMACESDTPNYNKQFRIVIDDEMLCPPDGNNCAYIDGHHIFKDNQTDAASRSTQQLLNTFYQDAAQNNVRRFFEQENWQILFPESQLNPTVMGEIARANYATIVIPGDSSFMFVRKPDRGTIEENVIFAFKRTDIINKN
jgi:hypothetical protein